MRAKARKPPRKKSGPTRDKKSAKTAPPRKRNSKTVAIAIPVARSTAQPVVRGAEAPPRSRANFVVVKDEDEAIFYFARIDDRLAEAWKRDVVVHKGPITIHIVVGSFFNATHYAYVDHRLFWYLRRDPSDPLGAKWEGYLKNPGDAPKGAIAVFVGSDIMAKKSHPQLTGGNS